MSRARWRRLAALIEQEEIPRIDVGGCVEVSTERFFLVLRRQAVSTSSDQSRDLIELIPLVVPGLTAVPWADGAIEARLDPDLDSPRDETVDLDQISPPVLVRAPVAGDRFEPLGMGGQSMPLADFFRGRHIDRPHRRRVPLVCDQTGIIWVVGHRIADRVKVTGQTQRRLMMSWHEPR